MGLMSFWNRHAGASGIFCSSLVMAGGEGAAVVLAMCDQHAGDA
jgi:hypothetical protein